MNFNLNLGGVMSRLRREPTKREKTLYWVMLVTTSIVSLKLFIIPDYQTLKNFKKELSESQPRAAVPNKKTSKNWFGHPKDIDNAAEMVLGSTLLKNVKIVRNQFFQKKDENGYQSRKITLSLEGTYSDLQKYLDYLENMPAPLVISELKIDNSSGDRDVLTLELSGDIYGTN